MKKFINKVSITYFFVFLCDIVLVILCAMKNKVHYVSFFNENIFVGNTRDMLLGRNFVNIIITLFFYIYFLVMNHFFLRRKNTKKFMIWMFVLFVFVNCLLFYIFTKKIY